MGGFVIRSGKKSQQRTEGQGNRGMTYSNFTYLTSIHLIALRETGELQSLPNVSLEDIDDKSKSDMFARLIAIAQITWIVLQVIVRAAKGLAISQLEVAVLAFSVCAITIYALNWKKPKGVKTPYFVLSYDEGMPPDFKKRLGEIMAGHPCSSMLSELFQGRSRLVSFDSPIQNDSSPDDSHSSAISFGGLLLGSIIFGGIQVAAWNFEFPAHVEQLAWRVTSLWCMIAFIVDFLLMMFEDVLKFQLLVDKFLIPISSFLYVLARLFLLVETFRTLYFLPPGAYITTWATNFPHLA
jgi:hypothetical protein